MRNENERTKLRERLDRLAAVALPLALARTVLLALSGTVLERDGDPWHYGWSERTPAWIPLTVVFEVAVIASFLLLLGSASRAIHAKLVSRRSAFLAIWLALPLIPATVWRAELNAASGVHQSWSRVLGRHEGRVAREGFDPWAEERANHRKWEARRKIGVYHGIELTFFPALAALIVGIARIAPWYSWPATLFTGFCALVLAGTVSQLTVEFAVDRIHWDLEDR